MSFNHVRQLGAGGFGTVDLVTDAKGAHFARKTFSVAQALPPPIVENVRRRFIREAKTQSGIRHQNIVPVVYTALEVDPPYYLMPVATGNLQDDLSADKTLGGQWLGAIADIVAALDEMHKMGIFHRDLKPQNVLKYSPQQPTTSPHYYAVSDFGLVAMEESRLSVLTVTGMAKGTDYYTAPEITSDLRQATVQSDIYSLGCILHEMVGSGPRIPCHEIRETGPFSQVLLSCTRSDPDRRFRSVRDVLDAVMVASAGSTIAGIGQANLGFADQLATGGPLSEAGWRELLEYVEDNEGSSEAASVLSRLSLQQVDHLCSNHSLLADRLATAYSNWVRSASLRFELCDYVANILERFIATGSFETKVDCLMALLKMGTSHNRWYVERKFVSLCGVSMDENLAKRLAVELRATGQAVCTLFNHLERSITLNRSELHPTLVQTLAEICQ